MHEAWTTILCFFFCFPFYRGLNVIKYYYAILYAVYLSHSQLLIDLIWFLNAVLGNHRNTKDCQQCFYTDLFPCDVFVFSIEKKVRDEIEANEGSWISSWKRILCSFVKGIREKYIMFQDEEVEEKNMEPLFFSCLLSLNVKCVDHSFTYIVSKKNLTWKQFPRKGENLLKIKKS